MMCRRIRQMIALLAVGSLLVASVLLAGCVRVGGNGNRSFAKTKEDTIRREFRLHVYFDNSASMQGYVNGGTEFVEFVNDYVSTIARKFRKKKGDSLQRLTCSGVEVFLLDTAVHPVAIDYGELSSKLLIPNSFQAKESETSTMIRNLLAQQREDVVTLFFTDGLFTSSRESVERMSIGIRTQLTQCFDAGEVDTKLLRLVSQFNGLYYPPKLEKQKAKSTYKGPRPYFCWVLGHPAIISEVASNALIDKLPGTKNGYDEVVGLKTLKPAYAVLRDPRCKYENSSEKGKTNWVIDPKLDLQENFAFRVGFAPKTHLLDESYFLDSTHYEVTPPEFVLAVEKAAPDLPCDYVLTFRLRPNVLPSKELRVTLKRPSYQWDVFTEEDGTKQVAGKTYGLNYFVEGIESAYRQEYGDELVNMSIIINK